MLAGTVLLLALAAQAPESAPAAPAAPAVATAPVEAASPHLASGLAAFRHRRFAAARDEFEKAVAADPQSAAAAFYLGYAHYKLGEPSRRMNAGQAAGQGAVRQGLQPGPDLQSHLGQVGSGGRRAIPRRGGLEGRSPSRTTTTGNGRDLGVRGPRAVPGGEAGGAEPLQDRRRQQQATDCADRVSVPREILLPSGRRRDVFGRVNAAGRRPRAGNGLTALDGAGGRQFRGRSRPRIETAHGPRCPFGICPGDYCSSFCTNAILLMSE